MFHNGRNEVCLLKRALYELKQSSRVWNKKPALKDFGLKQSKLDPCIYFKIVGNRMLRRLEKCVEIVFDVEVSN